jgi:predicted nucleic acid-binding protein
MYLIDTNLFVEILLKQNRSEDCKQFLSQNINHLYISDFTLHSIGVILFKFNREKAFTQFLNDTLSIITLVTLPMKEYNQLHYNKQRFKLDFDDAYQYLVSHHYQLQLVTMDKDFIRVQDDKIILF